MAKSRIGAIGAENVALENRVRFQLEFSPDAHRRLLRMRTLAGAKSDVEVISSALRAFEWFLEQKTAGNKLQIVNISDSSVKEVLLFF